MTSCQFRIHGLILGLLIKVYILDSNRLSKAFSNDLCTGTGYGDVLWVWPMLFSEWTAWGWWFEWRRFGWQLCLLAVLVTMKVRPFVCHFNIVQGITSQLSVIIPRCHFTRRKKWRYWELSAVGLTLSTLEFLFLTTTHSWNFLAILLHILYLQPQQGIKLLLWV